MADGNEDHLGGYMAGDGALGAPHDFSAKPKRRCRPNDDKCAGDTDESDGGEDIISRLPDECTQAIFSFLPSARDRCACAAVSKRWLVLLAHMRGSQFMATNPSSVVVDYSRTLLASRNAVFTTHRSSADPAAIGQLVLSPTAPVAAAAATTLFTTSPTIIHAKPEDLEDHQDGDDRDSQAASRCLEDKEANDARVAAMAVGTYASRLLAKLSVRAGDGAKLIPSASRRSASNKILAQRPPQRITDFGLEILSHSFPNLRSLALWDCSRVGSSGLAAIAHCCHALQHLDITNSPKISDDGLVPIAKHCPNLATLSLDFCPLVGDQSLLALAACGVSSRLRSIVVSRCPLIGDAGVVSVVSHLPNLTRLRLSHLQLVSDESLHAIATRQAQARNASFYYTSIRMLFLNNLRGLTTDGLAWLRHAPDLELLSIESCGSVGAAGSIGRWTAEKAVVLPPAFGTLKHLSFSKCGYLLGDDDLCGLTRSAHHLETLKLYSCNRITARGLMMALGNCSRTLKDLALVNCNSIRCEEISTGGPSVSTQVQRRQLELVELEEDDDDSICTTSYCGQPPLQLDSLTLKKCNGVDDRILSTIISPAITEQIKHLALVSLPSITDLGVLSLLRWAPSYRAANSATPASVAVRDCPHITDHSVLALAQAFNRRLHTLSLEGCVKVGDGSLDVLAEFCPDLAELDVSGSCVTDAGLARLASSAHQKLEVLSLAGCDGITDEGLARVEMMCGGLVGLNLQHCPRLSRAAIDSVRSTLWWCDLLV